MRKYVVWLILYIIILFFIIFFVLFAEEFWLRSCSDCIPHLINKNKIILKGVKVTNNDVDNTTTVEIDPVVTVKSSIDLEGVKAGDEIELINSDIDGIQKQLDELKKEVLNNYTKELFNTF